MRGNLGQFCSQLLLSGFCLISATNSQAQLSVAALPFLSDTAKARVEKEYAASEKTNKALVITEAGNWKFSEGKASIDEATSTALSKCQEANPRHPCFVAAENDKLVLDVNYKPEALKRTATEILRRAMLSMDYYSNENRDDGISTGTSYRSRDFHSPTPTTVPGAKTITTKELVQLLIGSNPVLINVLDWKEGNFAIPGTFWIQGMASPPSPSRLSEIKSVLAGITPDLASPIVMYCLSWECWMSFNTSLAALEVGYKNVYWYRGGILAWNQANLPIVRTKLFKQF